MESIKLTARQRKFIDFYDGNGTEAARLAGYKGSDDVLGKTAFDLLRNPKIKAAIEARTTAESAPLIASREKRQQFWTKVMEDIGSEMRDRLRASELLGKSQADFVERHELSGPDGKAIPVSSMTTEELQAEFAAILAKAKPDAGPQ